MRQIDIFDGSPADQAFLAPDDPDKAPDTYVVGSILERGGYVTVRCHYDDGAARDITLPADAKRCEYVAPSAKMATASLLCR